MADIKQLLSAPRSWHEETASNQNAAFFETIQSGSRISKNAEF